MMEYKGPYEGRDMAGYMLKYGIKLPADGGPIHSITNVRDIAIIVTEWAIYRAKPDYHTGFSIERLEVL